MDNKQKKVFMFYPPGGKYQRGEDRCQGNIEQSSSTEVREPIDMAYASAALKKEGYAVSFHDYQTENSGFDDLISTFRIFKPHVVYLSTTNPSVFKDIELLKQLKHINDDIIVIIKGALFFNASDSLLDQLDLTHIDYLIGGEAEFIIAELVSSHFNNPAHICEIPGIIYKDNGKWISTDFTIWEDNLDYLPLPDRSIINNNLYIRPDTGKPIATISTSKGCPGACIFCLTPIISGTKVRHRSPANILLELRDAFFNHGIENFFFKSDTFTIDREWVEQLCQLIIASDLHGKIQWVANSRSDSLSHSKLSLMKKAGCWLIACGFESGSQESLDKMGKGTTVETNLQAAALVKKSGLKLFGFYLIGLPWEDWNHLAATKQHVFDIDADYIEVHIATPYYGTALHKIANKHGLMDDSVLGKDYFNAPTRGTKYIGIDELVRFQRRMLLRFHLRPHFLMRKLSESIRNPVFIKSYFKYGMRMLKNSR